MINDGTYINYGVQGAITSMRRFSSGSYNSRVSSIQDSIYLVLTTGNLSIEAYALTVLKSNGIAEAVRPSYIGGTLYGVLDAMC